MKDGMMKKTAGSKAGRLFFLNHALVGILK